MTVPPEIVLAILTVSDGYVLQLRDNLPTIASPGCWGLFGGGIDEGEDPAAAIRRDIREELGLDITDWRELWAVRHYVPFCDAVVRHVIFVADVTGFWKKHVLGEGQATGVFRIDELPHPTPPIVSALLERYHTSRNGRPACRQTRELRGHPDHPF
jgi:8-oxo-dGTP pyrophosphatase MutT (NUDIX family)